MSLLFVPAVRPDAAAIRELAARTGGFSISLDPAEAPASAPAAALSSAGDRGNWLELLINGLTFDLVGLAPGRAQPPPPDTHRYGLDATVRADDMVAITIMPGPHLASGATLLPVVRSLAGLAIRLTALEGVAAVAWHTARSWCGPEHFSNHVSRWLEGGVFPALGLTALAQAPDGGMISQGLALFTGQELRIEPELAGDKAYAAQLALRLINELVDRDPVIKPEPFMGPQGERLYLVPSANGRFVRVKQDPE